MNDLAALLSSFDVKILFDIAKSIADAVGLYLSPVLLLMAIYIRLMETQVDALASGGKYGTALRDMMIWTFVLGSYYSIGALVIGFVNPIYTWLDSFGSLGKTMEAFSTIMAKSKLSIDSGGITLIGLASAPYVVIAELFYYGTLILVAFLTAFLKIANVMTFGIAFIWGLIAIPISISTTFRILRGWAYLLGFALVWPVVQGLLMAMFSMLFAGSSETLMTLPDADPMLRIGKHHDAVCRDAPFAGRSHGGGPFYRQRTGNERVGRIRGRDALRWRGSGCGGRDSGGGACCCQKWIWLITKTDRQFKRLEVRPHSAHVRFKHAVSLYPCVSPYLQSFDLWQ